jgi:hypothetical protein
MTGPDLWSRWTAFAGAEDGSATIALIAFAACAGALVAMLVLHGVGILSVPPLIYAILVIVTAYTGWDAWRERQKPKGD